MGPLALLLNELLFRPIFNMMMIFLELSGGSMGLAIIAVTLTIRLLMFRSSMKALNMQKDMQGGGGNMQKNMEKIQEKYKDDPQRQAQEMMKSFKKDGAGPLKGCMAMLVQIPVFLGLYGVISNFANHGGKQSWLSFDLPYTEQIYSFLYNWTEDYLEIVDNVVTNVETTFLGIDLLSQGNIIMAALTGVLMYANMKLTTSLKPIQTPSVPGASMPDMSKMMGGMTLLMVFMMGTFVYSTPAGIGLYMITTTLFGLCQSAYNHRVLLRAKVQAFLNKGKGVVVEKKG